MGSAIISISPELLVEALHLPAGTYITLVLQDQEDPRREVQFVVSHVDLPESELGTLPKISPRFYHEADGTVTMTHWDMDLPVERAKNYIEARIRQLGEVFESE